MIISHKYRFIFIKTAKTAGSSLEVFLSGVCGPGDTVTPLTPAEEGHTPRNWRGLWNPLRELRETDGSRLWGNFRRGIRFYSHLPAVNARCRMKREIWDSYFKFCVERNPFDKALSHYWMERSREGNRDLTFDDYLDSGKLRSCGYIYRGADGRILVDRVLRYERLNAELQEVFDQLGVPFDGVLRPRAKGNLRADRRPCAEVYTPRQEEIVRRVFRREFEDFGYALRPPGA